ncbi:Predicted thiol-disulfide oxidoreductase YuxK, DCC family [Mesonia phycicola]|uniref:Predicted thiol-disulfide oxidoreductase YuxK, DCC family n=1 Tax=Mesonia phycicola TaxID=579105 RepID=A0A1M6BHT2_9FLAO|nr:DCC1-like thiol-disulfide oxidoreductase family protein [Mesonia phycicola]SHI48237.1 Predicted thiol-disulfide oxidoreductase YuxK, DCC family [Mesonia phycicola]
MSTIPQNKKIILFDGVCNLCNNAVNKIIDHDKNDVFRFASLQSSLGIQLAEERGIDTTEVDSMILIDPGNAYYLKSTAALQIAKHLSGIYKLASYFLFIPEGFRNMIYDFIAKNRYKWFGKEDNCRIPTPELKEKFIE